MLRVILEPALLFLSPFAAYMVYLYLRDHYPFAVDHWTRGAVSSLALAGLAMAVAGLFLLGFFSERHSGTYIPAHIENGRLISGHME
jgi:TRAP-type mannitol/chloroaromatic compound transport system permease small subunit